MEQQYTYYAYISYKHGADSKHARWLRRKLDNYRLPSSMTEAEGFNQKPFFPTFLDDEYLQAGPEEDLFRQHLAASKYLIVICSKNSHDHPFYVNMEIRLFLETGHTVDQIIPLIVDEDSTDPVGECFPSALQEIHARTGIIGNSFKASNAKTAWGRRHDTFLKIVAIMLGVETAKIKRLDRRNKIRSAVAAGMAALVVTGSAYGYYWQNIKEHYSYYADYVTEYNVARGILPLTEREASQRENHYRFTTVGGNVTAVEYRNSENMLVPDEVTAFNEGASRIQYTYDEQDVLLTAEHYNYREQLIVRLHYYENGTKVARSLGEDGSKPGYLPAEAENVGEPTAFDRSSVTKYVQTMEDGRITLRQFANGDEYKPIHNHSTLTPSGSTENSVYGYAYTYDQLGRVSKMTYVGTADGKLNGIVDGVNAVYYMYDEASGVQTECLLVDIYDRPVVGAEGWAFRGRQVDDSGRIVRLEYYDAMLEPVLLPAGYFAAVFSYDGDITDCSYYGIDDAPVTVDGYHTVRYYANERGTVAQELYLDVQGEPVLNTAEDCYGIRYDYPVYMTDSRIEKVTTKLDAVGQAMTGKAVVYNNSYYDTDEQGKRIFVLDEITVSDSEYLKQRMDYDGDTLQMLHGGYYAADGSLVMPESEDYALFTVTYNGYGQVSNITYLDTQGAVLLADHYSYDYRGVMSGVVTDGTQTGDRFQGASGITFVRNEKGNVTEMRYLDGQGNLMSIEDGFAVIKYTYDEYGHTTSITYLCEHELPVMVGGFAREVAEYDAYGNKISVSYYGDDHYAPIFCEEAGFAKRVFGYDDAGRLTMYATFDVKDGSYIPMIDREVGFAKMNWQYDEQGNLTMYEVYGVENGVYVAQNNPDSGFAKVEIAYNDAGMRILYATYKAKDGKFVPATDPKTGYAKMELGYDEQGNIVSAKLYTTDGENFIPAE